MRQTKKGNQWYFGMKAHIGADAGTGYVHSVTATWLVAGGLLLAGLVAYAWVGFPPRPRRHPLR